MIKIGITETATNYANYINWFQENSEVEVVHLSHARENLDDLKLCDGLVFTGGIDIHPGFHLTNYSLRYPFAPDEFDKLRDEFELTLLEKALARKIPVLGICRGLQLINAFLGGTLHLDNGPEKNAVHKKENDTDKEHSISVTKDSLLFSIVQSEHGMVNSAHHQSINKLANGLKAVAISADGVIEAIELASPNQEFLLGVQWHPERMKDKSNSPFSYKIREAFLANVKNKLS